ncbi:hypothetical protein NDU88_000592 [Pleurodeles waltl]|uniref:Uncharacterized protein n=1 Tax=Pleurodeles waltl TaxID=8319 RepID=A0AAV7S8K2_PLEWA|nr:hypothetical protein NDU88_000592 [Pleurodeles waltl]
MHFCLEGYDQSDVRIRLAPPRHSRCHNHSIVLIAGSRHPTPSASMQKGFRTPAKGEAIALRRQAADPAMKTTVNIRLCW